VAIDKARAACNTIKRHPGKSLAYYDGTLDTHVRRRQYVINNVKKAVSEGWIKVFYQPVVRCDTGKGELCGYEALARWDDPLHGLLPPKAFIGALERFHLINKLDEYIVGQVCEHQAAVLAAGKQAVPVSVNLSRLDFQLCDIFEVVRDACERWNIPHELLAVEITESALDGSSNLRCEMDRFRAAGFEVWMDDFGCGYSSLNLLKDYEFDVLKVDMEFLRDMEANLRSKTIVASVIAMAQSLGIRTLVEGVETQAQREFLQQIGCDMMQGYLFGKPRPLGMA
jgi:EAL domain-containing protein (putative c-di-GMP-specific phosphodiesterase class I)